jgi:vanillate O-demethylase ferredoxin subunit
MSAVLTSPGLAPAALPSTQDVRIVGMRQEALDVLSLELKPASGAVLPFGPGAHIELHLPGGLRRAYSLTNAPGDRSCYRIAVHRSALSRGGSHCVHGTLRVGDVLPVSAPRNLFALVDDPAPAVLIAGGIGITPLWSMVQQLAVDGREWQLHYASRQRERAAFLEAVVSLDEGRVQTYFDGEPGGRSLDIAATVAAADPRAHLYCCGPQPMLQAFEQATVNRDRSRVHLERFGADAPSAPREAAAAFEVVLARSGRTLRVAPGQSILDEVLAAGIDAPSSCREGVCGTCETRVLDGVPDHVDSVLSEDERAACRTMMICCSRSKTATLVLDL